VTSGASGALSTLDTESGFDEVVFITQRTVRREWLYRYSQSRMRYYVSTSQHSSEPPLPLSVRAIGSRSTENNGNYAEVGAMDEFVKIVPVALDDQNRFALTQ